jgi:NTP pyrophosphatase (non-canonical NTP hydrolase)
VGGAAGDEGSDELLSVAEAALRYGLSTAKVRRMISLHELDGARKVRGETGPVWRIPASALEARGLKRQPPTSASPGATVTLELAELRQTLNGVTGALRIERQRLANKQEELEDALLQVGQLRRELKYERSRREDAEAQVERLRAAAVDLVAAEQGKEPSERVIDLTGVDRFALETERRRREGEGG